MTTATKPASPPAIKELPRMEPAPEPGACWLAEAPGEEVALETGTPEDTLAEELEPDPAAGVATAATSLDAGTPAGAVPVEAGALVFDALVIMVIVDKGWQVQLAEPPLEAVPFHDPGDVPFDQELVPVLTAPEDSVQVLVETLVEFERVLLPGALLPEPILVPLEEPADADADGEEEEDEDEDEDDPERESVALISLSLTSWPASVMEYLVEVVNPLVTYPLQFLEETPLLIKLVAHEAGRSIFAVIPLKTGEFSAGQEGREFFSTSLGIETVAISTLANCFWYVV